MSYSLELESQVVMNHWTKLGFSAKDISPTPPYTKLSSCVSWGSDLRFSGLYGKHFTYVAVSARYEIISH